MKKLFAVLLVIAILVAAGGAFYARQAWSRPGSPAEGGLVDIPHGIGARGIVGLLAEKKVIANREAALAYILFKGKRHKLQAGEYQFDRPMTIPEVIDKIASGSVFLHKFTVQEGLTLAVIAQKWHEQGFGTADDFLKAAEGSLDAVRRFDDKATTVEGYLFPETYSFPSRTPATKVVATMIARFDQVAGRLKQQVPMENWPLNLRDTVILASLVETEAAVADERPLVASVYLNRLNRGILLQCDPTVIYALARENRYEGRLTLADLQFRSPYNTYVSAGLPPGPIANPGYASMLAAVQPATTNYLYFVRTVDSRHTFSETLQAHNRAVAEYRKSRRSL